MGNGECRDVFSPVSHSKCTALLKPPPPPTSTILGSLHKIASRETAVMKLLTQQMEGPRCRAKSEAHSKDGRRCHLCKVLHTCISSYMYIISCSCMHFPFHEISTEASGSSKVMMTTLPAYFSRIVLAPPQTHAHTHSVPFTLGPVCLSSHLSASICLRGVTPILLFLICSITTYGLPRQSPNTPAPTPS